MSNTSIEWTDATWNPVRGCARVSPGCERCYAERQAHRFHGIGQPYEGLTVLGKHGPRWAGRARFVPEMLSKPLTWRKPQRVFVNSMSDLWHPDITNEQIAAVFGVMAACPQHTYQILTKRPERMREWFEWHKREGRERYDDWGYGRWRLCEDEAVELVADLPAIGCESSWPLRNVWLGVSCEDQQRADERIPLLLETPAAIRFVSAEPLLGRLDLSRYLKATLISRDGERLQHPDPRIRDTGGAWQWGLNWVIVGGESGPGARPSTVEWYRDIERQCREAGVAVFFKQLGRDARVMDVDETAGVEIYAKLRLRDRKGGDMAEWPEDLRVRDFPRVSP